MFRPDVSGSGCAMFARGTAEERGEAPETPKRLLFELLRPQSPRSGGKAPSRRAG